LLLSQTKYNLPLAADDADIVSATHACGAGASPSQIRFWRRLIVVNVGYGWVVNEQFGEIESGNFHFKSSQKSADREITPSIVDAEYNASDDIDHDDT